MSERKWLSRDDPSEVATALWLAGRATSQRKLRLFAASCCRRLWDLLSEPRLRNAVELAEQLADGSADSEVVDRATRQLPRPRPSATSAVALAANAVIGTLGRTPGLGVHQGVAQAVWVAGSVERWDEEKAWQCDALRDLFSPLHGRPEPLAASVLEWDGGLVVNLARSAYDERLMPSGELDPIRLAVLADALEDAGCFDDGLLSHLRATTPHLRGCWAVDVLLGKE